MEEFSDIPEALKRDLKTASPRLVIPPERDAAIKAAARPLLRRRQMIWRSVALIGAVAAMIAITIIVFSNSQNTPRETPLAKVPNDMNGDRAVDVRDALLLAQQTKSGKTVAAPWNPFITLSQSDVKKINDQIVTITPMVISQARLHGNNNLPRPTMAVLTEGVRP